MTQAGTCGPRGTGRSAGARLTLCALVLGAVLTARRAAAQDDAAPASPPASPGPTRHPLVYLRDIDPSIVQDIRYATSNNFTGRRVRGYDAAECMLLRDVAEALARVQQVLASRQLSLRVYDCYRPRRAVRAFERWVRDPEADPSLTHCYHSHRRIQPITL